MINLCIKQNCNFDWNLIVNAIAAIGTLGGFIFAIIIAKNISFKKDLRKKQLDTVFDLVNQLQNLKLYFSYSIQENDGKFLNGSGDVYFQFFSMNNENYNQYECFAAKKLEIYVSKSFLYENSIFNFVHNPFLPKSISLKLINIYPRGGNDTKFRPNSEENYVYISDDRDYEKHTYIKEISNYYASLKVLFNSVDELNKSIYDWLEKNGVDDLNIHTKLINITNYP